MPTDTMTDERVREILATKGMGWAYRIHEYSHRMTWEEKRKGASIFRDPKKWNPLSDLNTIREVEERLSEEQREAYLDEVYDAAIRKHGHVPHWFLRHASARTCAYALARVLRETPSAPPASK